MIFLLDREYMLCTSWDFPEHFFDFCEVFRGAVTNLPSVLQGSGDQAAVIMWKKNDNQKKGEAGWTGERGESTWKS